MTERMTFWWPFDVWLGRLGRQLVHRLSPLVAPVRAAVRWIVHWCLFLLGWLAVVWMAWQFAHEKDMGIGVFLYQLAETMAGRSFGRGR